MLSQSTATVISPASKVKEKAILLEKNPGGYLKQGYSHPRSIYGMQEMEFKNQSDKISFQGRLFDAKKDRFKVEVGVGTSKMTRESFGRACYT
jgi:hypothetical protein